MIFPYLRGFLAPHLAPVTYFLFALNVLVFFGTLEAYDKADHKMDRILKDKSFSSTQGAAFAKMIKREPALFTPTIRVLADSAEKGDQDARSALGSLALRNTQFMTTAEDFDFGGDEVALEDWRQKFHTLREVQERHPSYLWGISTFHNQWHQWVSYQFAHAGAMHLFWNMVFLLIFGAYVEIELGASFVILTYLGGGVLGAILYSELSGVSASPLIGASAAVSGLMSLVAFHWWKKEKLTFVYWLLPLKGYFGMIKLPSWIVIIVSLLPDLSSYISASKELTSVAYSAHLGGAACGAIMAGLLAAGLMQIETDEPSSMELDS